MEALFTRQIEISERLHRVIINFKKDSVERKTVEYCVKRLDSLEADWRDYSVNHEKLLPYETTNHRYFINSEFERTREVYVTAKELISQYYEQLLQKSKQQQLYPKQQVEEQQQEEADFSGESQPRSKMGVQVVKGTNSKSDDMMHKQSVNFKAFMRTVENIEMESMEEKWEFEDALRSLQSRWAAIDSLHWDIVGERGELDEAYESYFNKNEIIFNKTKKAINSKMSSISYREKTTPQMEIPTFTGNYYQWVSFKDLFTETIHKNPSLSNAQKMQFLKAKIKGEAERLIQHLPISSDNYLVGWEILKHRFDNKKLIFTSHINIILNLPNTQSQTFSAIKRLHDTTLESLHAIRTLGVDTSTWDPLLVHILSQKLDSDSYSEYIESLKNSRELPILQDFLQFLESKFTTLESSRRRQDSLFSKTQTSPHQNNSLFSTSKNRKLHNNYNTSFNNKSKHFMKSTSVSANKCPHCYGAHKLHDCKKFHELSNATKLKTIEQLHYCINCLFHHNGNKCISTKRCLKCGERHHTILHDIFVHKNLTSIPYENNTQPTLKREESGNSSRASHASQNETSEILLATALVKVISANGIQHTMRAIVDQGSQISLINERAAQLLGIKRQQCKGVVFGVGEKENQCKGMIALTCQSVCSDFKFKVNALIMNNLIKNLPNHSFKKPFWPHMAHIDLADPDYNISRPVDLLLGAEIYSLIMLDGIIRSSDVTQPLAQQTQLGWLLCGSVNTFHCNVVLNNIEDIHQFWQIEDIAEPNDISAEDLECVEFYHSTTKRLPSGRYEVRLPLKQQAKEKLGMSKAIALAQFRNLERRFCKDENLATRYKEFMREYQHLGHMKVTCNSSVIQNYLPHHPVQRLDSITSRLRVVFNASSRTASNYSLNDLMHKGPNLQRDLQELILKWRQYRYAYTADIEKMFRMILVSEEDQGLQQVLWREHPEQPILSYQLTTVTYGTKAAPFLAMMTLRQLAADEEHKFPKAAKSLREDMYMDDYISGAHSVEEGVKSIAEINSLLGSGGFLLRKWAANEQKLLKGIDLTTKHNNANSSFIFKTENTSKTLGLHWNSVDDEFTFHLDSFSKDTTLLTKRKLLSEISKMFDPLGWLAPLTTKMKLLFQKVWLNSAIQWNNRVPEEIESEWGQLKKDMIATGHFKIPRWLQCNQNDVIELHGFCDASPKAFACVCYARIVREQLSTVVLVAAKTRLVPSSKTVSLPRLELSSAELLTKLMSKIIKSLDTYKIQVYCWSDSMVTLSWIQGNPNRWKPFVSNRVKKIQDAISKEAWFYVSTKENPADIASRGATPPQLHNHSLWWFGPSWLREPNFKPSRTQYTTILEVKKHVNTIQNSTTEPHIIDNLLVSHSSLTKIIRVTAWILRAFSPLKHKPSYITLPELRKSKELIIKHIQYSAFANDIELLKNNKNLHSRSKLLSLNPFLDENNLLRVGGRLKNSTISQDMKYPIIIPYNSRLTELLINQAHSLTFHGGARLTLSLLRQKYWIIKGNRATKAQLRNCVVCKKQEPRKLQQIMGNLPDYRTNPAPAFFRTGVDCTGFIRVKANKGRGIKTTKGYIVLFICMVTKAVHIEVVSDMSSSSFIAALRRMSARRGTPKHMYSDQGSNFIKSNRVLKEEYQHLKEVFSDTFFTELTEMNIEWHWNCPSWPSAVGIWERSIRSLKQHMKRVIGEQALTFEEYSTLLAQIEACLNSRPLCPLSEDIDDLDFLTPAHFLTARPGLTVIETEKDARTRWHLTSKIFQDIWKRWKTEYLSQLSLRQKWLRKQPNVEVGDMVTIHDDFLPSGRWPIGRVTEIHPGNDGNVRVVTLKTKNGFIKRPIVKLSILPIRREEQQLQQTDNILQTETSAKEKTGRPTKRTYSYLANFTLLFLFFLCNLSGSYAYVNIKQLSNNQTIYFDELGKMQLARDEWKLIVYYDMAPYWEGYKATSDFTNYLDTTCDKIKNISQCHMISEQVRQEYNELQYYNQLLLNQQDIRTRARRGLVNGVGSIANTLFGILDDSFAEKYKQDIEQVRLNQNHLTKLWRNQTSVVEAEYNLLKRTEETIQRQHKFIHKHLSTLDSLVFSVRQEINSNNMQQNFALSAIACNNLIQNLRRTQETLIDTITDIYRGQIDFHLITPKQLRDELQIISGQISKDLTLPIENFYSDLHKIYHSLKIRAKITDSFLIFEITIPLVSRDSFHLHQMIPIPFRIENSMVQVKTVTTYIAINLRKDTYLTATINDIQNCIHTEDAYLCHLQGPIRHMDHDEKFCELETSSSRCLFTKMDCKNIWIPLREGSTYFYFCCDSYSLRIICEDDIQARYVSKAGLISITKNCIIKGRDITLYAHNQQFKNQLSLKTKVLELQSAPILSLFNISLPTQDDLNLTEEDLKINGSLKHLEKQISMMKKSADHVETLSSHIVHNYVLSYGLLAAGLAVFLWFLCRRRRRAAISSIEQCNSASVSVRVQAESGPNIDQNKVSCSEQCGSVSVRVQPGPGPSVSTVERNVSLRTKDRSTSPIVKKQSVFSIDDSRV